MEILLLRAVIVAILLLLLLQLLSGKLGLHDLALRDVHDLHRVLSNLIVYLSLELSGNRNTDHCRVKVACLWHAYSLSLWQVEVLLSFVSSLGNFLSILHPNLVLVSLDFNPSLSL